jgi:hypothetical protein
LIYHARQILVHTSTAHLRTRWFLCCIHRAPTHQVVSMLYPPRTYAPGGFYVVSQGPAEWLRGARQGPPWYPPRHTRPPYQSLARSATTTTTTVTATFTTTTITIFPFFPQ